MDGSSGSWQGESAQLGDYFFRKGIPQFWAHFFPSVLSTSLTTFLSTSIDRSASIFGLKSPTFVKLAVIGLELVIHPLKVAQLHYAVLPERQGGFTSTANAFQRLWACGPQYLWTGLTAVVFGEFIQALLTTELIFPLLKKVLPPSLSTLWVMMTQSFLQSWVMIPFRVIATQAMSQTPLLKEHPRFAKYSPMLPIHVAQVWRRDGILGFFRGAPIAAFHGLALTLSRFSLYKQSMDPSMAEHSLRLFAAAATMGTISLVFSLRAGPTSSPSAWHV